MRFPLSTKADHALTLIELLLIVVIAGILFAMLFPMAINHGRHEYAPIARARSEQSLIVDAVQRYYTTYGHFPVTPEMKSLASAAGDDLTFGGPELERAWKTNLTIAANSDLMAILMDMTTDPGGRPTANTGHLRNPKQIKFLTAKMVTDIESGCVGPDLVYRDPWGHSYIISLDLNEDGKTRNLFYRNRTVSQSRMNSGFFGLTNSVAHSGASDTFEVNEQVMVWSLGPDGKADVSKPANQGANKDNVPNWK